MPGYVGAGYIVFDPVSGDGAYKISGGGNGGLLNKLKLNVMLFAGAWSSFAKKHPIIAKALGGSIGLIIGTLVNIVDLMTSCEDAGIGMALSIALLLWNIVFLGVNILLVGTGVAAGPALLMIAGFEWYLETQFKNKIKHMCM